MTVAVGRTGDDRPRTDRPGTNRADEQCVAIERRAYLHELLERVRQLGFAGAVLHFNNLELLARRDPATVAAIAAGRLRSVVIFGGRARLEIGIGSRKELWRRWD